VAFLGNSLALLALLAILALLGWIGDMLGWWDDSDSLG
jgi:hypothetical protein